VTENPKIRVALVGVGRIADLHAGAYAHEPRAELYAVCDIDEAVAQRRAEEWGARRAYTDLQQALDDDQVDAVEILTPTRLHVGMVRDAAAAGKHTSVQKPMALNIPDARAMISACEQAGVTFKICENYVFYPPLVKARQLIDEGAIGQVLNVGMRMVGGGSGGWDVAPEAWQWRLEEAQLAGGPTTFDHGHHMYSSGWYLGGEIDKMHAWINHIDAVVDSPATVQWNYAGGLAQGSVQFVLAPDLTMPAPYYSNDEWYEVVGSKGILWVNQCTARVRTDLPPLCLYTDGQMQPVDDVPADWAEGFNGALRNFIDAITGEAPPLLSGEEGLKILAYDLAAQRSHLQERSVYVEEMYAARPGAVYARRRKADIRARKPQKDSLWSRIFGSDDKLAPRCRELTEGLTERFDGGAVPDWSATIALDATGEGGGQWTFSFDHGAMELHEELLEDADLTVQVPAGTWAAIIEGKRSVESAFLRGKLKVVDGKPEVALPLRKAFGL